MDSNQSVSLSPTLPTPTPHPSIRAPLSYDSDFESALKTHSRSNSIGSISGTSAKSFVSEEEGFLSGEDGFETASEKHEDNLELAMEGEDILAKPALGSSRFSNAPPKARVSFDDEDYDEDAASEVVDDGDSNTVGIPEGIEKLDKGVEVSGVLEGKKEEEEDGSSRHHENGVANPLLGSGEIVEQKVPDGGKVEDKVPEEKVADAAKASVEEKVPEAQEAEVDALPESKEDVLRENQNLSDTPENGVLDSQGKGVSNDSATLVEGGDSDSVVSEVSQEPLVAHKEDISTEFPKLDVVVNPHRNGVQEKEDVEPVQEVSVEAVVPKKPYKDVLLDSRKLDAVASHEIGVEGKEEVEPVQEKEIEENSVEALVVNKKDEGISTLDASKLDVVGKPEAGMEVVETEVEAIPQKQSEEVVNEAVANKETILPEVQKMEAVANTDIDVEEKEEIEPIVEAIQVKESVEIPNEAPKEDIVHEVPKLDSVVNPELGAPEKEEVETKIEALQKGSEEVGGEQDEIDENKIAASVENAVPVDSMLVEADKEVKSTSEEASLVATEIPAPGDVPDAAANVKPVESENENSVDDGSSELNVSEKIPELVESSATETRDLEQQDIKINMVESQIDDDEKDSHGIASSPIIDSNDNSEKPEVGSEVKTDTGSEPNGPAFRLAVDEDKDVSGDKKDDFGGDEMQELNTKSIDAGTALQDESKTTPPISDYDLDVKEEAEAEAEGEAGNLSDYQEGEGSSSDEDNDELNFGSSGTAEQIMKELMRGSGVSFRSGAESSQDGSQRNDGQILMDSDEEVDTDEEGEGKELFDSAALAALLKAATSAGPEGGNVTMTTQDGSRLFSVERPAGLGSSIRSLKPTSQPSRPNIFTSSEVMAGGESENPLTEEDKKKLEKLQHLRVKFLRLIHRIGHSPDEAIAAQVLYRMVLAAGRQTGQAFSLEAAKKTATQLEAENSNELDFSLNILVLGKTGVGKSATINSIFGEEKAKIGAFEPSTTEVRVITGTVGGVNIRILDTPGLRSSLMEQAFNRKVLSSVKKLTKKFPVDILLYVDRLDTQTRDLNDLPLLKVITSTLGSSIWKSAIVTLTHAASAPPDGPSGSPLSYEVFVAQRSHIIQQSIGQAVGDLRMMNPSLMNPVSLVENHPSCRKNRDGQRILPNGQVWRPQLLLLCYSLKVLSEVSSLSKPQDPFDHRKLFGFRVRAPPLPYLLSSLLQSRAHPKLPDDQGGDNVDSDIDLEDLSDSDREEEEDEYDQLPPFKPLRKAQIANLSNDQKKAYFDEYDYRVKLLQKKQWKEELKRMKEMKKRGKGQKDDFVNAGEDAEQEGPAAVPVPLPDMVLPPSFDGDNPAYRYRFLEPTSQLLARPVLDTHGWDHDCGYDGVSLEENLAIAGRFPGGVAVQITKDKKEFNIHLDSSIAAKHGENGSTLAGFDIQTIGKQLGYIVRGETKFKNFKKNKTTGGVSVTFLGENVATGLKVEDQICIGKRLTLVGSTGTIRSQGDAAYGANLEATLKDKDFPIGQDQATLGLSLMRWRGDLALGANLQSQFSIGRSSKMSVRVGLNNKLSGQITVRTSSSEQLQLALVGILPIAVSLYRSIWPSTGESFSAY